MEIDSSGRITSMIHHSSGNQVIPTKQFGNQIVLFDDIPLYWDAWDCMDYHIETRNEVNRPSCSEEEVHVELATPLKVTLKWSQAVGQKSRVYQKIHITAVDSFIEFETRVQWAENRKFLKVEFPVEVLANQVSDFLPLIFAPSYCLTNFLFRLLSILSLVSCTGRIIRFGTILEQYLVHESKLLHLFTIN